MASIKDIPEVRPNSQSSQPDDHPSITPREGDQSLAWNGMSIHSCAHCQKVEIDIRHRWRYLKKLLPSRRNIVNSGKLHLTYSEVRTAIADGCTLFERWFPPIQDWWGIVVNEGLQEHLVSYNVYRLYTPMMVFLKFSYTYVYAGEGDPASRHVKCTPPYSKPPSDHRADFSLALSWLENCNKSHPECAAWRQTFTPKRLLAVGHEGCQEVGLFCLEQKEHLRYTTLSYCWGGEQNVKLTKDVVERTSTLRLDILPRTIREAVIATRRLGVKYLWVDALCIVQDDLEEKEKQIAQMGCIFRGAYVTLAAATASGGDGGLFCDNNDVQIPRFQAVAKVSARISHGGRGSVILSSQQGGEDVVYQPLFTRGWTFQEGLLSSRILCYGSGSIRWYCPTAHFCDRGLTDHIISKDTGMDPGLSYFSGKRPLPVNLGFRTSIVQKSLFRHPFHWQELVSAYRERRMTFPSDALVGISAVAEVYGSSGIYGRYCAGLWERDFARQLAWFVTVPGRAQQHELSNSGPHDCPRFYAPSWSWASKDEAVTWELTSRLSTISCRVLEIHVEQQTSTAPFGDVRACWVRLHGRLKEAAWYSAEEGMVMEDPKHGKRVTCNKLRAYSDARPVGLSPEEYRKVYCLELFNVFSNVEMGQKSKWLPKNLQRSSNYFCGALILAKGPSSGDFHRVGYLTRDSFDFDSNQPPVNKQWWREGWESRDITIV